MHGSVPNNAPESAHPASRQLWEDIKQHSTTPRLNSELVVLDAIRSAFPNQHVILTSKDSCDLVGFAKSGAASATLQTERRDFEAFRTFKSSGKRIDEQAALFDKVKWGCFDYVWSETHYQVYMHEYFERLHGTVTNIYICYPGPAEEIATGRCEAIDNLLWACGRWTQLLHNEIYVFDGGFWSKSRALWESVKGASWDDVILDPTMKDNVKEDVEGFFSNQDLYKQLSVPWKRGIIFHGHPGNGKTITIKALIGSLYARKDQIPSLYVKSLKSCNGKEFCIRAIFSMARSMAPCLLIFEDLDSLVTNDVRSYFLNEVDGLESNDGILMIGSTNHLDRLDPAIAKRPSRFDRKYHFMLPAEKERILYCDFWKSKVSRSKLVEWPDEASEYVAKLTDGFSFAYMKELFVMTLLNLARGIEVPGGSEAPQPDQTTDSKAVASSGSATESNEELKDLTQQVKNLLKRLGKKDDAVRDAQEDAPSSKKAMDEKPSPTKRGVPLFPTSKRLTKRRTALPSVPKHLQKYALIAHIRHHVQLLLDDMDNTADSEVSAPMMPFMRAVSMDEADNCDDC